MKQYLILVLVATAYLVVSELDYRDKVAESQEKTQKYIKLLATAMNGGAILDKHTDTAYFFDKPLAVKINIENEKSASSIFLNAATKAMDKK